jgi:hypothetical protein
MVDYDSAAEAVQNENADPAFLARIAYENPEFGPNVAAHPRAYPGLLAWLAQFGTEKTKAIVEKRKNDLPQGTDIAPSLPHRPETRDEGQTPRSAAPRTKDSPTFTPAQAMDPTTDPMTQHDIAEYAPQLRVYLAQNPNIYPELLAWLISLNDPQINAAVASRRP